MALVALAVVAVMLGAAVPADAATAQERRLVAQVRALKAANARQATRIRTMTSTLASLRTALEARRDERDAARADVARLTTDLATRTTERDNALAGLPAAISAAPRERFWELVFTPARTAWPCDSYYSSTGYWSLTFTTISEYC